MAQAKICKEPFQRSYHLKPKELRTPRFAIFRSWAAALAILVGICAMPLSAETSLVNGPVRAPSSIVIGFVGGFVRHDNPHHGPVMLGARMRHNLPSDTYVQVFENRHRKIARNTILRLLDADHNGVLSREEKTRARIILFGQSWGGAAVVLLARDLRLEGVPVLLTVQVDSVAKLWQNDAVIPDNVAEAVNFYQSQGIIHGRTHIAAADPAKTQILGNYHMDYKKEPVSCPDASWYDRIFTPGHTESECDPRLWSRIEDMVRERIGAQTVSAQATPQP